MTNNRIVGAQKEEKAVDFLIQNNIVILERNFRTRFGEIDIIGLDNDTYVFFEVKYRTCSSKGFAAEAVNVKKQKTICRVSDYFRLINNLNEFTPCRFDVIAIDNNKTEWIKNAFDYIGR